jgi:hypothetical protein
MRNLNRRPSLPDGLAATTALASFFAEHDDLHGQAAALQRAIEGLARDAKDAAEKDKLAAATALRAGKSDPGDGNLQAIGVKRSAATRRAAQIGDAQALVVRDIERLLEANGTAWGEEAIARASQARLDAQAALDAFRAARELVADLEASARWLRTAGQAKAGRQFGHVPGLIQRNGQPFALGEVVAALSTIDEEPASAPPDPEPASDDEPEEAVA